MTEKEKGENLVVQYYVSEIITVWYNYHRCDLTKVPKVVEIDGKKYKLLETND